MTGPKTDLWLVKMVGLLVTVIGLAIAASVTVATKVPVVWSVSVDWSRPGDVIDSPLLLSVNIESELATVVG